MTQRSTLLKRAGPAAAWCCTVVLASCFASAQPPEVDLEALSRRDPAAAAVLDLPRDNPTAQVRAILALIDLGHAEAASRLLADLAAAEVSEQQKAALVERFGVARLLRLARQTAPGGVVQLEAGRAFVESALEAAAQHAQDPQRLAAAIEQLDAAAGERRAAQKVLQAAGEAGIRAAVATLAANPSATQRAALLQTLAAMRPAVNGPVVALLAESRGPVRRDAIALAGRLRLFDALPWLAMLSVGPDVEDAAAARQALADFELPLPTPAEAAELVRRELAETTAQGGIALEDPLPGRWWRWDREAQSLQLLSLPPRQVHALQLAQLADALAVNEAPVEPSDQVERLLYRWEAAAALDQTPDAELVGRWESQRTSQLSDLLAVSIHRQLYASATQAARLLGERGEAEVLTSRDGQARPLATALSSPHEGLRFAALQAVLKIAPETSFAGASGVVDSLWHFAAGAGDRSALAAAGTVARANLWAGQLRGLGYDATAATTGRGALTGALDPTRAGRLALVVVDSDLSLPGVREVIFQLRRSDKIGRTPIGVLCSLRRLDEMQQLARDDPWLLAAVRPQGREALAEIVEQLVGLRVPEMPSDELRLERAAFALTSIADLLANSAPYDEIVRDADLAERALYQSELTSPAMRVLQYAGTSASQAALADYASAASLPLDARRMAAQAFKASVERFGIQLPAADIARQYDLYNASANADESSQALLSGLLDAIEGK